MEPVGPQFDAMFTVVPVLVAVLFVAIVATGVYRAVRLARRGVNPLTLQEDLAAQALRSRALQRPRTKAERLDELDRLRALGRISEEELLDARARILAE